MALQDPQDPTAGLGAPAPWEWPAEFQVDPRAYGIMPMDPALSAPPVDPLQIGGTMGVVENAAAPALAAPPPPAPTETAPPLAGDPFNVLSPISPIDQTMADLSAGTVQAPPPGPPIAIPSPTDAFGRIASDVGAKVGPEAAQARWDGLGEDEKVRTLTSNPALLQQEEIDLETERLDRQREMIDQARANDQAQADQNARDHVAAVTKAQAETQRISAEAMQLANTKVVRDRRSGGRKFLDVIMGAIGGLVSAQTGGPNQGLAMVLKRIDDDVEDQKAELQNKTSMLGMRRSIVGEELARSGDMYKAQELARLAAYDATMADITTESMRYRPGSSRVIALTKMRIGLAQQRQAALDALQDRDVKRVFDRAKADGELLDNETKRRKLAGIGGAGKPAFGEEAFNSIIPPAGWAGTQKQWIDQRNAYLAGKKTEQDLAGGGKVGEEQRQQQLEREMPTVIELDEKGNRIPYIPKGGQMKVDALRAKDTATREIVNLLDQAMALRTGWSSDVGNSDEKQQLDAIMGAVKIAAKNAAELGAITKSDEGLIEGMVGTTDFSKFRDMSAAVGQARLNFVNSLRTSHRGAGLSEKATAKFDIPNLYGTKAKREATDDQYEDLRNNEPSRTNYERWAKELGGNPTDEAVQAKFRDGGGMFPSQLAALRTLYADAKGTDQKKREAALEKLEKLVKGAKNPHIQATARSFLEQQVDQSSIKGSADDVNAGGSLWRGR